MLQTSQIAMLNTRAVEASTFTHGASPSRHTEEEHMLTNTKRRPSRLGLALAAGLGLGLVSTASTAMADQNQDPDFDAMYDVNHDGVLSAEEQEAMYYDRDQDGRVDGDERGEWRDDHWNRNRHNRYYEYRGDRYPRHRREMRFRSQRAARIFVSFDRNRNGRLSRWEVDRSWLGRRFYRIDRNGDGRIAPWELDRFMLRRDRQAAYRGRAGLRINVDL